jgi:hypothetical protein
MRRQTEPRVRHGGITPFTAGSRQYAILAVGVLFALIVTGIVLYPDLYVRYIQEFGIKRFEAQYGFRTGQVAVRSSAPESQLVWGIVWVVPGGVFSRLGLRDGDIPFAYHGGMTDMYGALQQASSGEVSSFQVYNAADAHLGAAALRRINLPAAKP